jgi:hypothetical protein
VEIRYVRRSEFIVAQQRLDDAIIGAAPHIVSHAMAGGLHHQYVRI